MWQKCPICDGEGRVTSNGLSSSVHQVCSVCNGAKIISELSGLPPHSIELPSDTAENTADYIDRHIVEAMVEVAKKPINFPSDEDIIKNAPVIPKDADDYLISNKIGFVHGAKWMKKQILKQNK